MADVPAILNVATLGSFRLGYMPTALAPIREARVTITIAGAVARCRRGTAVVRDIANDAPNTCRFTVIDPDTPPLGQQRIRVTVNSDDPTLLFTGALETVENTFVGTDAHQAYACLAQDDTPKANRLIPLGYWENVSATQVAQELVASFAPGFTATGVQASLPNVTLLLDGTEGGMNGCLRALVKQMGGGYFYWLDQDLHLFQEEPAEQPDDLDSTPGRILNDPHIQITIDDAQLRTTVFGKGHAEAALAEIAVGLSVIPVGDVSYFKPTNGQVKTLEQILNYTGTVPGGLGALVGTTVTPTNAPTGALVTHASGIDAGDHYWAYTFYDGTGETLPSPLSATLALGSVVTAPSAQPVATRLRGGNLSVGAYQWKAAFVDSAGGITTVSPASASVSMVNTPTAPAAIGTAGTTDESGDASLDASANYNYAQTFEDDATGLESELSPVASFATTLGIYHGFLLKSGTSNQGAGQSRHFYRTEGGGSVYKRLPGPENGFQVDAGSYWYEGYSDGALGVEAPTVAHYKQASVTVPVSSDPNVVSVNIYRTEANGSTFKLAGNVANGVTSFADNVADGSLGATAPSSSTAVYRRVNLSGIAAGPSGTTGRKVYRTAAGGVQLKLAYTIADNTTTTQTDSLADSGLGANVPTSNTSGLVQQTGDVPAGSTSLLVTSTAPYQSGGGWASIGNLFFRYTGFSATALTGIPASGVGALNSTVRYGAEVIAPAMLIGVSGITRTIIKGQLLHVWVERNDTAAQAALAAREGEGDGIIEHTISDERRNWESLEALCDADLAQFSMPLVTVTGAVRDVKMKSGKPLVINLASPLIDQTLTVQDVTIDQINMSDGVAPRFTFTASSIRFSVEDLLRRMASTLEGV